MAKENFNSLYGMVESIALKTDPKEGIFKSGRIVIKTVRRPYLRSDFKAVGVNRTDKPVIFSRDPELIRLGMNGIRKGDFIYVRGNFCSQDKERKFICKKCGELSTDDLATASYIDPVYVRKVKDAIIDPETGEIDEKGSEEELFSSVNISNYSVMIGMVCREPEGLNIEYNEYGKELYRYKFEIAVNRVRLIKEDPADKNADFVWVSAYGELAKKCSENLRKGSIVLIYGAVHSRENDRMFHIPCSCCGEEIYQKGFSYEIIPYDVLFLENCKNEEFRRIGNDVTEEPGYMNEVYMLGVIRNLRFIGRDKAAMTIETKKRTSVTDEYKFRAREEYDLPFIMSHDDKVKEESFYSAEAGEVIFVKGNLASQHKYKTITCPFCGYRGDENKVPTRRTYVDPVRMVPFFQNPDNSENGQKGSTKNSAMKIIRASYEITNQVLVVGLVYNEPSEDCYYHDPSSMDSLRDRFEFDLLISRTRNSLKTENQIRIDLVRVVTFGKWAREAFSSIRRGSALMINGALVTKDKKDMYTIDCGACGRKIVERGSDTYLLPYRIEYLRDCYIPQTETQTEGDKP